MGIGSGPHLLYLRVYDVAQPVSEDSLEILIRQIVLRPPYNQLKTALRQGSLT